LSALGDLLELLHDAASSFERLRGEFRIWTDLERNLVARQSEMEEADLERLRASLMARHGGPIPHETEDSVRLWVERPGRVREERESQMHGRTLAVQDGTEAWRYMAPTGAVSQSRDELGPWVAGHEFESLLDPSPLMGVLTLEPTGISERAGRPVWSVRAQPRVSRPAYGRAMALYSIGAEADEWHLEVDTERGVVLRLEARYQGEPMRVVETLEVSFDDDFPPDTFVFTPPAG
jgi:outer membrane lipoprotein-sorting protein